MTGILIFQIVGTLFMTGLILYAIIKMSPDDKELEDK